ncbi:hypothetical protein TNCV_550541 [Trichonephila clavipes]|nr:hypothetical protein TNCV_550541 [Trichonephila clavipes]
MERRLTNWRKRMQAVDIAIVRKKLFLLFLQIIWFGNSSKRSSSKGRFIEWPKKRLPLFPIHKRICLASALLVEWLRQQTKLPHLEEANPQVYVETPLHPEKLTVWCAFMGWWTIGPYFFKNDEGHNVTVNGDRYRAMITNFFIPELNNHDVQELWFQQRRRNMSHSSCHNRFIERHVW